MENAPKKYKKRVLVLFALCLLLGGSAFWWGAERARAPRPASLTLGEQIFTLEISATPEARALGLGGRENLCGTCGMLFLFERPGRYGFWMKDMRFPIDIVWLFGELVVHIERAVPPDASRTYQPPEEADRVIELGSGAAAGLQVGERVQIEF